MSGADWADRAKVEALLDDPAVARKASTLEELAGMSSLPPHAAGRAVAQWNALVPVRGVGGGYGHGTITPQELTQAFSNLIAWGEFGVKPLP